MHFKTIICNVEALRVIQTKNFKPLTDRKLLCTCGNTGCDKRSVNQGVLNMLQLVRDDAMRGLTITSGGRCFLHPEEAHRANPADHQKTCAIDIRVNGGLERGQLVRLGLKYGFNAIGIAKTFVHLGFREGEPLVIWTY
jgi:hypothetical protein